MSEGVRREKTACDGHSLEVGAQLVFPSRWQNSVTRHPQPRDREEATLLLGSPVSR